MLINIAAQEGRGGGGGGRVMQGVRSAHQINAAITRSDNGPLTVPRTEIFRNMPLQVFRFVCVSVSLRGSKLSKKKKKRRYRTQFEETFCPSTNRSVLPHLSNDPDATLRMDVSASVPRSTREGGNAARLARSPDRCRTLPHAAHIQSPLEEANRRGAGGAV